LSRWSHSSHFVAVVVKLDQLSVSQPTRDDAVCCDIRGSSRNSTGPPEDSQRACRHLFKEVPPLSFHPAILIS
jgi:hypothetical protein